MIVSAIEYLDENSSNSHPEVYLTDSTRTRAILRTVERPIEDARALAGPFSLDREGFMLAEHPTSVSDFMSLEAVRETYLPEVEALLKRLTGATHVRAAREAALVRVAEGDAEESTKLHGAPPGRFAHNDYCDASARQFAKVLRAASGAATPAKRVAAYNVWRCLSQPPQDVPLAICDARTVSAEDRVLAASVFDHLGKQEYRFDFQMLKFNPAHRWYYYPDMHVGEALVFKAFDSDDTRASYAFHCAFTDPRVPKTVPTRISIEVRAFAFFEDEP